MYDLCFWHLADINALQRKRDNALYYADMYQKGGGTKKEIEALGQFGRRLGFLYRLAEEIKDTYNLDGNLIRRLENESIPLPILYAAQSSKKNLNMMKSIFKKEKPISKKDLISILKIVYATDWLNFVDSIAKRELEEGINYLNMIKPTQARKIMKIRLMGIYPNFKIG